MTTRKTFKDFQSILSSRLPFGYAIVSDISAGMRKSFKICISDLIDQLAFEYNNSLNVSSMAYESENDYAKLSHDHDIYTSAFTAVNAQTNSVPIATIFDETHLCTAALSAPTLDQAIGQSVEYAKDRISSLQPHIGEVQMLACCSSVPPSSDPQFIGWLPADGASYQLTDFVLSSHLTTIFNSRNGSFSTPDLQHFFKFSSSLGSSSKVVDGKTSLLPHAHEITSFTGSNIECKLEGENFGIASKDNQGSKIFTIKTYDSAKNYGKLPHNGTGNYIVHTTACTINANSNTFSNTGIISTVDNIDSQSTSGISYPSYMTLSAFVYVGRSRFSSPLYDF